MSPRKIILLLIAPLVALLSAHGNEGPSREAVEAAMMKGTDFLFDTFANRGGFVWFYLEDGAPYGELKARPSMIWVEPPSTPAVGLALLEAYGVTNDTRYVGRAKEIAGALTAGQHPSGGWNYFIDFDPDGLQAYYDEFFSKLWGWQEYLKNRPNATFDDFSTTEPTRFFLRLYAVTNDPAHKAVLDKALGHILAAQDPKSGGWPQRYPPEAGHADYSSTLTFNDGVVYDCILVLLEAADRLDDERYAAAAKKGMDFYLVSQLPAPQAGWAQQYSADLQPAWGRPFEIGTVCAPQTHENITNLFEFYQRTGDTKYLDAVPAALDWLEASVIPNTEGFTHTCFYEMDTNRPIYIKQTGSTVDDVKYTPTYDEEGCYPYAHRLSISVDSLRTEFDRLRALSPDEARTAFAESAAKPGHLPEHIRGGYFATNFQAIPPTADGVATILATQEPAGGWKDTATIIHPYHPFTEPPRKAPAYVVGGYLARMYRMMNYLALLKE